MTRPVHIYALRDPRTGIVRYVGKTVQSLSARLASHISDARSVETKNARWIRKLVPQGLRPAIEELEQCDSDWAQREAHWIAHFKLLAGSMLNNHTCGGEGAPGFKRTVESIAKSAAGCSRAWTPERRATTAAALAARNKVLKPKWSDARRAAVSNRNRRLWTAERRAAAAAALAARNKILKPQWTAERRARQAEVARRVNAVRWAAA